MVQCFGRNMLDNNFGLTPMRELIRKISSALLCRKVCKNKNSTTDDTSLQVLFDKAVEFEESDNLEDAYQCYLKAAEAGMPEAMFKLYDLFVNKGFHAKEENNMLEQALSGKPVMPWDVFLHASPDVKSGLYWLSRAAELGHAEACCSYGYGLCESGDTDNGLHFLKVFLSHLLYKWSKNLQLRYLVIVQ